jgi:hypothetical protein
VALAFMGFPFIATRVLLIVTGVIIIFVSVVGNTQHLPFTRLLQKRNDIEKS